MSKRVVTCVTDTSHALAPYRQSCRTSSLKPLRIVETRETSVFQYLLSDRSVESGKCCLNMSLEHVAHVYQRKPAGHASQLHIVHRRIKFAVQVNTDCPRPTLLFLLYTRKCKLITCLSIVTCAKTRSITHTDKSCVRGLVCAFHLFSQRSDLYTH